MIEQDGPVVMMELPDLIPVDFNVWNYFTAYAAKVNYQEVL
jgi:hypothetical protein